MRPQLLTWKELLSESFAFDSPFRLNLAGEQELVVERVLRIIPQRRMVVLGSWQGRDVVAKLFFDVKRAKHHFDKDIAGIQLLQDHKVPTPRIYAQTLSDDQHVHVLILEHIAESQNLEDVWLSAKHPEDIMHVLRAAIVELATQHVLGVVQKDLHLKNFLCTEKVIYTLDGAQIELVPHLLPKKPSMQNLALFLSQFGAGMEVYQEKLFRFYAKSRGWLVKQEDVTEIFFLIKSWNEQRWLRYAKKIFRDSTHFARKQDWTSLSMHNRAYAMPEFQAFLQQPEMAFLHPSAIYLKNGRSSTVIKVELDGRELVVKRYNLKNSWHFLRRCMRPTRAYCSWRLAQKLNLFGISTAKPVAFIEKRMLNLRGTSYYVTEYVQGQHAQDYFGSLSVSDLSPAMIERIVQLLKTLAKVAITHGDLKATNILINAEEKPVLIDLDGAVEHLSLSSLNAAWRKEIKRFLQNFQDQPVLLDRFKTELSRED